MEKDIEDIIKYLEEENYYDAIGDYDLCTIDFSAILEAQVESFRNKKSDCFVTLVGYPIKKSKDIIGFVDIKTKRRIVNRLVSGYDEYGLKEFRDIYSNYGKKLYPGIGDVGVDVLPLVSDVRFKEYNQYSEEEVNSIIDSLESYCLEVSCPHYDEKRGLDYYNQEIYICPLNQGNYLLVRPTTNALGQINGYIEIVTGQKIIKVENPDYYPRYQHQFMYLGSLKKTKRYIDPIDICKKATRLLTPDEIENYKSTNPEVITDLIDKYIDRVYEKEQVRLRREKEDQKCG